jgi:hypothetical protein
MKDNKLNSVLTIAVVSAITYMFMEAFKTRAENILRTAAGESQYERFRRKKK